MTSVSKGIAFFDGWFTQAGDLEYGPTLVTWTEKGLPNKPPETDCDHLTPHQPWKEFFITPAPMPHDKKLKAYKMRLSIEILDVIELE